MINGEIQLLNIQLKNKISKFATLYKAFTEGIYALFCFMLDDPIESFWYECISMTFGYFQLLIFILDETVSLISINLIDRIISFGPYGIKAQ